ncbi:MAG: DUF1573 domain-containing protein [Acidobacteriota bacterium]|nr:DUF1573 domain-containing protein [Acidobacteriota bacterium]
MYRSGLVSVSTSLLFVLILTWIPAGARSSVADRVAPADFERLKERVSEYFEAVHSRQFTKAKEYILPRSRDAAGAARPGRARVAGFSILEVKLEEGNRSAVVTIRREIMAAGLAGQARIKEKFRWKKEEGEWFLDPADPPRTTAEIFREYYYAKRIARANPKPGREPPPLLVEPEERVFDFGLATQGDVVRPRFTFRNLGSEAIVIEEIYGPEWLLDKTKSHLVPAGKTGQIQMELSTSRLHRDFIQDIFVRFEPIQELVKLRIKGKVYTAEEIAESPILSKEAAAGKSSQPATP